LKSKSKPTSETGCCSQECCRIVAIVSLDAKGQMVLPKELREQAGFAAGDKLAVTAWQREGKVVCLTLTQANDLAEMLKNKLEPLMKDVFGGFKTEEK
jgi:antitoxin PrlF